MKILLVRNTVWGQKTTPAAAEITLTAISAEMTCPLLVVAVGLME